MQFFVDGELYGTVDPGEGFYSTARQQAVPHAMHWVKGTVMAPLDEMVIVIDHLSLTIVLGKLLSGKGKSY